jgi:polyisoprenoid-binding protein YceI
MPKLPFIATLMCLSSASFAAQEHFTIDPLHTFPNFTVNHLGFSTMHGRFGKTEGTITMDKEAKTGSVEVTIDASSINTGYDKRDDDLLAPGFLDAVEFPDITYKSTKVTLNDDTSGGTVDGNLTIKGVTKPVTLTVDAIHCGINPMDPKKQQYRCGFNATAKIMRSDFNVKAGLPLIGDELNLSFEVEAIRD